MPASNAAIGYDTAFGIEGGTPGTYVDLAEVKAISPPGYTRDAVDVTHLKSDNGYMEYIGGMIEAGEATITLNYIPAASASDPLFTDFETGSGNYQITFPSGIRMQFAGIVVGWEPGEVSPSGVMEVTATFKASGPPSLLAAA